MRFIWMWLYPLLLAMTIAHSVRVSNKEMKVQMEECRKEIENLHYTCMTNHLIMLQTIYDLNECETHK